MPQPTPSKPLSVLALLAAGLAACGGGGGGSSNTAPAPAPAPTAGPLQITTVASGLDHPWGLAFLPDGRYLVTERAGRLRLVASDGTLTTVSGLPAVRAAGQGGLLDIALDPAYAANRRIYWSYAEAGTGADAGRDGLAVARGVFDAASASVSGVQLILRQLPKVAGSSGHYGGRIAFGADGRLFVTMGDRQLGSERGYAQDLTRGHGKVARIEADGGIPADNPYLATAGARPELWSHGHRNPQGAAVHPTTGALWTVEHGPQGGDEVNITLGGRNHGWPLVSHGCEYGAPVGACTPVGGATSAPGMEPPLTTWVPTSTAPSGLMFYTGTQIPEWQGKAFTGALAGRTLWQLDIDQPGPVVCTPTPGQSASNCREVAVVQTLGRRIRDVRQGPDGWVYLLTDQGGGTDALLRLQR